MRPKLILSLISIAIVLTASAQKPARKGVTPMQIQPPPRAAYYSIGQLDGKWQEVKRTSIKTKQPVGFSDTLLLRFDSNKVEIRDATSMRMTMRGDAFIEPPYNLIAAGDEYIIRSLDKEKLVLDDGENLKELHKKQQFYYETLGKLTVETENISTPVNVDQKKLEGKWIVYRRQALAGTIDSDAVIIKSIDIFPGDAIGSAMGRVVCYKTDVTESWSCKIIFSPGNIQVITDKYAWEFQTYKADGKEFVFGEVGRMLYYAKH